jgi:hypothetical protein
MLRHGAFFFMLKALTRIQKTVKILYENVIGGIMGHTKFRRPRIDIGSEFRILDKQNYIQDAEYSDRFRIVGIQGRNIICRYVYSDGRTNTKDMPTRSLIQLYASLDKSEIELIEESPPRFSADEDPAHEIAGELSTSRFIHAFAIRRREELN